MFITLLAFAANRGGALRSSIALCLNSLQKRSPVRFRVSGAGLRSLGLVALSILPIFEVGATSSAILSWDPNPEPDIAGYRLSYGTAPGVHNQVVEVLNATEVPVENLVEGTTYYFVVAAFNQTGFTGPNSLEISYFVEPEINPSPEGWSVLASTPGTQGHPGAAAIDGISNTFWESSNAAGSTVPPHDIQIDLSSSLTFNGLSYLPRQDNLLDGTIGQYEILVSSDGVTWGDPVASGSFIRNHDLKEVRFTQTTARYILLRGTASDSGGSITVAEIGLIQDPPPVATNHAPTAVSATVHTNEDNPRVIVLEGADSDGDTLSFSVVGFPAHGTLSGTPPELTYTPAANFHGSDQILFKTRDGFLDSLPATISISVDSVNDAPIASNLQISTGENTSVSIPLIGTDLDGDTLTFIVLNQPAHGTLSGNPPNLTYTPATNFGGNDSFSYKANDGSADSQAATVSILVSSGNHAPIATSASKTTAEDTPLPIILAGTDGDGDPLTFALVSPPAHGSLTGTPPTLSYRPAANYHGPDQISFKVNDGSLDSAAATVSISVTPVNDAPTVADQFVTTQENKPLSLTLAGSDVDNDPLTFTVVSAPANGTLSGTPPNLTFTPAFEVSGMVYLVYKVNDGTTDSQPATISLLVTAINHAPVAASASLSTQEGASLPVVLSATDKDKNTSTFSIISGPLHGTLTGKAPNLTYTPNADFNGNDSFTYKANDGSLDSLPATISILVTPINHAPVGIAVSMVTAEDTPLPLVLGATDRDENPLTFRIVSQPAHGSLSGAAPNLTYVPAANFHGSDLFTFAASDGLLESPPATISINVSSVNDTPVVADHTVTTEENQPTSLTLAGEDVDGDSLTFIIAGQPSHGTLAGTPPNVIYTPVGGFSGNDSFTYKAGDGSATSPTATISIRVNSINHAPVASAAELVTSEDVPVQLVLDGSDQDGDSMTFTVVSGPAHGTLTGTVPNLTYVPTANFHGSDLFTFSITDGSLTSAPATVSINVSSVNDAPSVVDRTVTVAENQTLPLTLAGVDVDNDWLTITIASQPAHGALTGIPPNVVYTPVAGYSGNDSFTYKASDGASSSLAATITIRVSSINHPPVATGTELVTAEDLPLQFMLGGTDQDGDSMTFSVISNPVHGTLSGTPPNLTYIPNGNYHGSDLFTFEIRDGTLVSAPATVSISVTSVNDAPVVADNSFITPAKSPLTINLTGEDVDGDALTFALVSQPEHGLLTGELPDLVYLPVAGFEGDDQFTYKANDGDIDSATATISISVSGGIPVVTNTPPVFTTASFATTAMEGQPMNGQITATDQDDDKLIFSKESGPSWLSVSADGTFSGTPPASDVGRQVIRVKVADPSGASAMTTLTVTVSAANHAPVFTQDILTSPDGSEKIAYRQQSLASSALDPDAGDRLTFSKVAGPEWLRVAANGSLRGTPAANTAGTNRFTIRATDNHGASADCELEIRIVANRLPLPWKLDRLGKAYVSDPATFSAGVFTVAGTGAIEKTEDAGNFGWQKLGGNGTITARIRKIDNTGKNTRIGLMIRQSLASDACQAFIGVDGNGKLHWLRRTKINRAVKDLSSKGSKTDNSWLRLKRKGNNIVAYRSENGIKWEKVASGRLKLPKNCYIGLSVSSGDDEVRNTSRFSNVRVKP